MIQMIQEGTYRLFETKRQIKILILDGSKAYAWINAPGIGQILVLTHRKHTIQNILNEGNYRMYNVKQEPYFADLIHIELSIGRGKWQGYLLLSGLPSSKKKKNRIIPTHETISKTATQNVIPFGVSSYHI